MSNFFFQTRYFATLFTKQMDLKAPSPLGNWMFHKILSLDVILARPTSLALKSHHDAIGNILLRDFILSLWCH
jgi:hypothetical protein